jgi:hypothetical protein
MGKRLFLLLSICFFSTFIFAQGYKKYNVNQMMETKWRYNYMLHLESAMVLHKADVDYNYYLYLKANLSYMQWLNGELSQGVWSYSGDKLQYEFKDILEFTIIQLTEDKLVLEFTRPNSRGHFQYHFTSANEKNPFPKPKNELPLVTVKEKRFFELPWWMTKNKDKKAKNQPNKETGPYINIELVGGGYYGGIDPVLRDIIHIKNDGRLIKEFQTKTNGLTVTKKNIPREELEKFCEFVFEQQFFNFDREYDCESEICELRKRQLPKPVPLRLSIAYGNRKKVVTISIWGTDETRQRYVNYPPSMDNIIDAIQRFALRMEDK